MMPATPISDGPLLIREPCLHLVGAIAHAGVLILTEIEIRFVPIRRVDRLLGAREHLIDLRTIEKATFGGVNQTFNIRARGRTFQFLGRGAQGVYQRLRAHLDHQAGKENTDFVPGERVLVSGFLYRLIMGSLGSHGALTVTNRRLRFTPGPGIERRLWSDLEVNIPITDIKEAVIAGVRRRLELTLESQNLLFGGVLVAHIYSVLVAQGIGQAQPTGQEQVLGSWSVQLASGPILSPGRLVISTSRLLFEPSRRLDAAVGIKGTQLSFREVEWLRVVGRLEPRLVITAPSGALTLAVDNPSRCFLDLVPLIASARGGTEPPADEQGVLPEGFGAYLLERWRERLSVARHERVVVATRAIQWLRRWWVHAGWLLLTSENLVFVPLGAPRDDAYPLCTPLSEVVQRQSVENDTHRLIYSCRGRVRAFTPACGAAMTERFWALVNQYTAVDKPSEPSGPLAGLIGPVPFVEFIRGEKTVAYLRPARIVAHEDGLGVFYPGTPPLELAVGAQIMLKVGSKDGLYHVSGDIVAFQDVVGAPGDDRPIRLVIVACSPDVTLANRRAAFRMEVNAGIRLRVMLFRPQTGWRQTSRVVRATLTDLSVGGCSIITNIELTQSAHVMLTLPPRHEPIQIEAEVLDSKPTEEQDCWRSRLRFFGAGPPTTKRVNDLIMTYQREATESQS